VAGSDDKAVEGRGVPTVFNLPPERIAAGLPAPDRPGWEATQLPEEAAGFA
jgi:hypothetical protein